MKIAMIVERFPPDIGGSGIRFYRIAEHLSKKHAIDIFTLGFAHTQREKCNFNVYRFNPKKRPFLPFQKLNRVACLSFITFTKLLHNSYDLVDVDAWPFLPFFSTKTAKPNMPTVVSWNVAWPFSYNATIDKTCRPLAKIVSKLSTYNITVSNFAKEMLQKKLKMNPNKIKVIPNGIDEEFSKAKIEPELGRIIFVGRLEPQKRLDLALKAFTIFKKKVSNAELHIVGSGPLQPPLAKASRKISGVYLHKPIALDNKEELIAQLKKSWIFVSASEFESYGLSIAEALSVGLPVVLTRTKYNAAINEFVRNGYNGLIVEHNQPKAIARALEKLYKNQKLWATLSQNAKYSTPFFPWDNIAKKVEELYKKLTEKRR